MLTKQEILARIKALAELIHADYQGIRPVMICILKGASPVRY
jgi:hypoxanthine-guanine phosphoribosyltransferase